MCRLDELWEFLWRECFLMQMSLFVNVCLDFSIAQYMEDWSLFNIQKDFAPSGKKKKTKNISQTY